MSHITTTYGRKKKIQFISYNQFKFEIYEIHTEYALYLFLILSSISCCAHSCSLEPEDEAGEDLCVGDDDDDDDLEQHVNEVKREYMT